MDVRTSSSTSTTHYATIDGVEYVTTFPLDEIIEPRITDKPNGTRTLVYATRDDDPMAPETYGAVIVVTHAGYHSQHDTDPDSVIAEVWEEFSYDADEDEAVERMREWLTEHRGIDNFVTFSGRGYSQSEWWKGYAYIATDDPLDMICDEFNAWAAGDVYGIVTEVYEYEPGDTDPPQPLEQDAYWGVIGDDYAQQCVNEESGNVEIGGVA